jgi:hypothetical protein
VKRAAFLTIVGLLAASCGSGGTSLYTRQASAACFTKQSLPVGGVSDDFVASSATGGAFRVALPHNSVTVSFGQTADDAANLDGAYRRFRAKNVGIDDILRVQGNAVMLWRVHPEDKDLATVTACLKGS